jgi:hypothetical protein
MSVTIEGYGANFFQDQHVAAADLNMVEYSKTKLLRDYLTSLMKTPGVLTSNITTDTSLKVITQASTGSTTSSVLTVNPGIAIDQRGRLIYVPAYPTLTSGSLVSDPLYYPARPERTNIPISSFNLVHQAGSYFMNLYYATIEGSSETDDAGNSYATRIYDSYRFALETDPATEGLTLAKIGIDDSGHAVVISNNTNDPLNEGYTDTAGNQWSIIDYRPAFEIKSSQVTNLSTTVSGHTTQLGEMLDKTITFNAPSSGQEYYTYFSRDVSLVSLRVFVKANTSQSATVSLYTGPADAGLSNIAGVTTGIGSVTMNNLINVWRWTRDVENVVCHGDETMLKVLLTDVSSGIDYISVKIEYRRV